MRYEELIRKKQSCEDCVCVCVCVWWGLDGQGVGCSVSEKRQSIKGEPKREKEPRSLKHRTIRVKGGRKVTGREVDLWAMEQWGKAVRISYFIWCSIGNHWGMLKSTRALSDIHFKNRLFCRLD